MKNDERLTRILDGEAVGEADAELAALLHTAAYLRESLTETPAPRAFRAELLEWLLRPRRRPWWRRSTLPAAIGAGAVAAVVVGVIVLRSRRPAVASA